MYATAKAGPEGGISHGQKTVFPNSVGLWKKQFVERGAEIFAQDVSVWEYERSLAELEQILGKKEVEIALLRNFLGRNR
jgi:hypothetical protein